MRGAWRDGPRNGRIHHMGRRGNLGTRILFSRFGTIDNTTQKTFHNALATAQHYDAFRLIYANNQTSGTYNIGPVKFVMFADATDLNQSSATFTSATFGGATTVDLTVAPGANRLGLTFSDWMLKSSLPRTDGGTLPLIAIRTYANTSSATFPTYGNGGSDALTGWATHSSGRIWAARTKDGDHATTTTGFDSVTNVSQGGPLIGIQYAARGRVITVMSNGDSVFDGRGTVIGEGFIFPACHELSEINGIAVEYANFAIAGQSTAQFGQRTLDILGEITPDILVFPAGSPNSWSPPAILSANIDVCKQWTARALAECREKLVLPVICTTIPTNPSVEDYDATDSLRRDYNDDVRDMPAREVLVCDNDLVLAGTTDVDGQVSILSGATTDGIHPNDTGNALLKAVIKPILAAAIMHG